MRLIKEELNHRLVKMGAPFRFTGEWVWKYHEDLRWADKECENLHILTTLDLQKLLFIAKELKLFTSYYDSILPEKASTQEYVQNYAYQDLSIIHSHDIVIDELQRELFLSNILIPGEPFNI